MHISGIVDFLKPLTAVGASRLFDTISKSPHFTRLALGARNTFNWPKKPGVYVIRRAQSKGPAIYVGMVGRLGGEGCFVTKSGLNKRVYRWTPYFFDAKEKCFRYGPKCSSSKSKKEHLKVGYESRIYFKDLEIDCLSIDTKDRVAPAAIEAILLQAHLEQFDCLPAANRHF